MRTFAIELERRAERDFASLPEEVRKRFYRVFLELSVDPFRPRPGCDIRRLHGERGLRAVRVGDYRAIYRVVGSSVRLAYFAHRSVAYRG